MIGLHGNRDRITNRRFRSSHYDYNFGLAQIGRDLLIYETQTGWRDHLGVFGAFGRAHGDVNRPRLHLGSNQFSALTIGGYWTLYSPKEAYLDTVIQGTRYYDAQSDSIRLAPLKTVYI